MTFTTKEIFLSLICVCVISSAFGFAYPILPLILKELKANILSSINIILHTKLLLRIKTETANLKEQIQASKEKSKERKTVKKAKTKIKNPKEKKRNSDTKTNNEIIDKLHKTPLVYKLKNKNYKKFKKSTKTDICATLQLEIYRFFFTLIFLLTFQITVYITFDGAYRIAHFMALILCFYTFRRLSSVVSAKFLKLLKKTITKFLTIILYIPTTIFLLFKYFIVICEQNVSSKCTKMVKSSLKSDN